MKAIHDKSPMLYFKLHYLDPAHDLLRSMGENFSLKLLLTALAGIAEAFLLDHAIPLMALVALMAADAGTGVVRALRAGNFVSSKFRHTGIKLFCYLTMIGCTHVLSLLNDTIAAWHLDRWLTVYFAVTEVLSVGENVEQITGVKLPTRLFSLLKKFLGRGS